MNFPNNIEQIARENGFKIENTDNTFTVKVVPDSLELRNRFGKNYFLFGISGILLIIIQIDPTNLNNPSRYNQEISFEIGQAFKSGDYHTIFRYVSKLPSNDNKIIKETSIFTFKNNDISRNLVFENLINSVTEDSSSKEAKKIIQENLNELSERSKFLREIKNSCPSQEIADFNMVIKTQKNNFEQENSSFEGLIGEKQVYVKLSNQTTELFIKEILNTINAQGANVVKLLYVTAFPKISFVMEYLPIKEKLFSRIKVLKKDDNKRKIFISKLIELLKRLYNSSPSIYYKDIHINNIFIDSNYNPILIDFGEIDSSLNCSNVPIEIINLIDLIDNLYSENPNTKEIASIKKYLNEYPSIKDIEISKLFTI